MTKFIPLLSLLIYLSLSSPIDAREKSPTISPWLYKQLSKTEELIARQAYPQARKKLKKLLPDLKDNSYSQALTLRSLASIYALENQYKAATQHLLHCLSTHALPENQQQTALLNLGQLYMATELYQKTINTLAQYQGKKDAQILALLANAHAQLKHYKKAIPYIEQAIKQSKKPPESWLQLNLALYYELEKYTPAAKILRQLIAIYPNKKTYWQQLGTVYQQLKQFSKALSIQHMAYKKGFDFSEAELLQLFSLYVFKQQPYQAAELLTQALKTKTIKVNSKHWEMLAHAWTSAREYKKAITALEKSSSLNEKGELYLQLGRIHVEQERWAAAIKSINQALSKGGLKNQGEAYILLGLSHYEMEKLTLAKHAFNHAITFSKTKESAQQWLKYIERT
jgi:tetratricopeptide (TPR) repeat protein